MSDAVTAGEPLATPVLFLVFNRPDTTREVFETIRAAQPARLYVACDGPRAGRDGEAHTVAEVRALATAVDWPCEVFTLFRDANLGCKRAVGGAISWFFEHEEHGIILEDDCLPHPDFFPYCQALLERFASDERVWLVTGDNFQAGRQRGDAAYYFSRYPHIWGWASWRRAWRHYDEALAFWPEWQRNAAWQERFASAGERAFWAGIFERMHAGKIDTWDYAWMASVWHSDGLTATPNRNLVTNIGFGEGATHTVEAGNPLANLPSTALGELSHPAEVSVNSEADAFAYAHAINPPRPPLLQRAWHYLLRRIARPEGRAHA